MMRGCHVAVEGGSSTLGENGTEWKSGWLEHFLFDGNYDT